MVKPLMAVPVIVFGGLAALFYVGVWAEDDDRSAIVGRVAPSLPDQSLPGTELLTPEMLASGEVTLVNFWAQWCPPCRAEHSTLHRLSESGLRVAGVNFRDEADKAAAYLQAEGDPFFAIGFDPSARIALDWGVVAPPETFIVGPDGVVLDRFTGPLVGSDFEQRFLPMLEAAGVEYRP